MAYTTIDKPTDYFNTVLYTGNGSTGNAITGVGFQPDWVWIKNRTDLKQHHLFDVVRGATKFIESSTADAEATDSTTLSSFDSDGFTLGNSGKVNGSSVTAASWNWLAGGTASSNSDGGITTSVSANTVSGFSIVKWTGNGSATTLGHGLGAVPKMIMVKTLDRAENWVVYHVGNDATAPEDKSIRLDGQNALQDNNTHFNDTAPTSSVFSVGASNGVNPSGEDQIAYCFAEKKGFSKFGSWTGVDGVFIYTGFKPAFILGKNATNGSGYDWWIFDNKRDTFNDGANNLLLRPNGSDVEATFTFAKVDFLSNGFRIYGTDLTVNGSGDTMIYMAFAEAPFVSSGGIPTTAR